MISDSETHFTLEFQGKCYQTLASQSKNSNQIRTPKILANELDVEGPGNLQSFAQLLRDALDPSMSLDKETLRWQKQRRIPTVDTSVPHCHTGNHRRKESHAADAWEEQR